LNEMWNELTSDVALTQRGWFDLNGLREIRRLSQKGNLDLYMLQWAILTIELWARQFIDRNPANMNV
jgi:asparagine synthase (glutamine-hydrolysing)